jgi:hypothetical protein
MTNAFSHHFEDARWGWGGVGGDILLKYTSILVHSEEEVEEIDDAMFLSTASIGGKLRP